LSSLSSCPSSSPLSASPTSHELTSRLSQALLHALGQLRFGSRHHAHHAPARCCV
jgi:hypothetical protein